MRIISVEIKNFRSIKHQKVDFSDKTILLGANGAGKSTVLTALNVFFRNISSANPDKNRLYETDFHKCNTKDPITVEVTFGSLSEEAKNELQEYVRHDQLVICAEATYSDQLGFAEITQHGYRMVKPEFAVFFEKLKEGAQKPELMSVYLPLQEEYGLTKYSSKDAATNALREYEESHIDECELLRSPDQFYGVSKGKDRLEKFIQWVYIPAVKDAASEQLDERNTAIGQLVQRLMSGKTDIPARLEAIKNQAKQEYQQLMSDAKSDLEMVGAEISTNLEKWVGTSVAANVSWSDDEKTISINTPSAKVTLKEGEFEGEVYKFGHGLQRAYIVALMQALAQNDLEAGPVLVLACEEPELYQHPPQIRHLDSILGDLSDTGAQIIYTTHSPLLVNGSEIEQIRKASKNADGATEFTSTTFELFSQRISECTGKSPVKPVGLMAKLHKDFQPWISELLFSDYVIFVESLEDSAYILTYLKKDSNLWKRYRGLGGHIVPVYNKSNLLYPIIIANLLKIPHFVVFDMDNYETHETRRGQHKRDNSAIFKAMGDPKEDPFSEKTLLSSNYCAWTNDICDAVKSDIPDELWSEATNVATIEFQHTALEKNPLKIALILNQIIDKGHEIDSLKNLCQAILSDAENASH